MRRLIFLLPIVLAACAQQPSDTTSSADSSSMSSSSSSALSMMDSSSSSAQAVAPAKRSSSTASIAMNNTASSVSGIPAGWDPNLTAEQLAVLRDGGTETPFTSPLLNEHRKGTFVSADCGKPVFRSEQKFDSGTGWPSFWAPVTPDAVVEKQDTSFGMTRTEIQSPCGGHLGHVFNDGPQPTGLRYCMNGLALKFIPDPVQ